MRPYHIQSFTKLIIFPTLFYTFNRCYKFSLIHRVFVLFYSTYITCVRNTIPAKNITITKQTEHLRFWKFNCQSVVSYNFSSKPTTLQMTFFSLPALVDGPPWLQTALPNRPKATDVGRSTEKIAVEEHLYVQHYTRCSKNLTKRMSKASFHFVFIWFTWWNS